MGKVIESDTAIATMMLNRTNSVHYSPEHRIFSSKDAIVRIGFAETRNLVLGMSVVNKFGVDTKNLGFQRAYIWTHTLTVASIANLLARYSRTLKPDIAFVAGLVHDLGKLSFDGFLHHDYEMTTEAQAKQHISLARTERERFGINHTDMGQILIEKYRFPKDLINVATYHHAFRDSEHEMDPASHPMIKLIHAANALAKAYRLGNSGDEILSPYRTIFWIN